MKVRLVKGPFGGKVMNHPNPGASEIIISGPRKMNRKQKWEYYQDPGNRYSPAYGFPDVTFPTVRAHYRLAVRPHVSSQKPFMSPENTYVQTMPCMHPDGSIFYEYVEGSKSEVSF